MKHLFVVHDNGTEWAITGTRLEMDDGFEVDPLLYYESPSEEFYLLVKEFVEGTNSVSFLKGVSPADVDDITVTPLDELSVMKARARTLGAHSLKQHCDFTIQFDFFEFNLLNNKFIEAGYVITDANREAKYLEIINTGDPVLIDELDRFLEAKDRISVSVHHYNNFISFKTAVNNASSIEEVNTAFATFANLYN